MVTQVLVEFKVSADKSVQSWKTGRHTDVHMDPHAHCPMMEFTSDCVRQIQRALQTWEG